MDYLNLIDKIPFDKLTKLCKVKKNYFQLQNKIVKKEKFLNSFGSYNGFIWATKRINEDIHILKDIINCDEDGEYNYCLIGRLGIRQFIIKYINDWFNYFYRRSDLDIFRRIYITFKKTKKLAHRNNYKYCFDLTTYFKQPKIGNMVINRGFTNKEFKRLNLYTYSIKEVIY